MKTIKIRYYGDEDDGDPAHAPWDTDTMYLCGENSIALVYRSFNKVEFYSKTPTEYSRVYNFYGIKPK